MNSNQPLNSKQLIASLRDVISPEKINRITDYAIYICVNGTMNGSFGVKTNTLVEDVK